MAGRQSAAMQHALALVAQGMPIRQAARTAGVWYTSLHAALKKIKENTQKPHGEK